MLWTPPKPRIEIPTRCPRCGKWRDAPMRPRSPRGVPFWPTRSDTLNAKKIMTKMVGGVPVFVMKNDGGTKKPIVAEDGTTCCCAAAGDTCTNCGAVTTPATWTVSFLSIALSTACVADSGAGNSAKFTTGSTLSGTFSPLTQLLGFPCVWQYFQDYSTNVASWYSGGDELCSGVAARTTSKMRIVLTKTLTNVSVIANLEDSVDGAFVAYFYSGGQNIACNASISGKANDNTTYGALGDVDFRLGKDGTMSATPS